MTIHDPLAKQTVTTLWHWAQASVSRQAVVHARPGDRREEQLEAARQQLSRADALAVSAAAASARQLAEPRRQRHRSPRTPAADLLAQAIRQ